MAVDEHLLAAEPSRYISTCRSGVITKNVIIQEVQCVQVAQRTLSHLIVKAEAQDEAQDDRAFKKWQTSSEARETDVDELAKYEAEVAAVLDADGVPEADPDGEEWGDLDAESSVDPLMVSKYVVEIFKYMKQTEVRAPSFFHVA